MQASLTLRAPLRVAALLKANHAIDTSVFDHNAVAQQVRQSIVGFDDRSRLDAEMLNLCIDAQMGMLYWHLFPTEWRRSTRDTGLKEEPSARQDELMTLLGRELPIDEFGLGLDIDERPRGIPVWRLGVSLDEEWSAPESLEQRSTAEIVMACLLTVWGSDEAAAYLREERGFSFSLPIQPETVYVEGAVFRRACQRFARRHPSGFWGQLPDALCTVGHLTGNFMLDYEDERADQFWTQVEDLGWTLKGYRRLKKECQKAEQLLASLRQVCVWLDAAPEQWPNVFALWVSAFRKRRPYRWRRRKARAGLA